MTQEEKQLVLIDLCARLPYGVIIHNEDGYEGQLNSINNIPFNIKLGVNVTSTHRVGFRIDTCKPYLRPMSSMTEEEKIDVEKFGVCSDGAFHNDVYDVGIFMDEAFTAILWFLKKHFDINHLIEKGLALEAPEGMYKTN